MSRQRRMPFPALTPWTLPLLAALGLIALSVLYFDLQPMGPINDDWQYAWQVGQLASGHGLRMFPTQTPPGLVSVVSTALLTAGHTDPRLLRLALFPYLLLCGASVFLLARDAGADAFWRLVATAAALTTPLLLAQSITFMTDLPYVALLLASAVLVTRWIVCGRSAVATIGAVFLTTLQRQFGAAIALAVVVSFLSLRPRPIGRREAAVLAAVVAAAVAGLLLPLPLTPHTAVAGSPFRGLLGLSRSNLGGLFFFAVTCGLFLLPFFPALAQLALRRGGEGLGRQPLVLAMAVLSLLGVAPFLHHLQLLPGNVFTLHGLNPVAVLLGRASDVYPAPLFVGVELTALAATLLMSLVIVRSGALTAGENILLTLSLTQVATLLALHTFPFDRYYIPPGVLLVPLTASICSRVARVARWARVTAGLVVGGNLGLFLVGAQDTAALVSARDTVARRLYAAHPASEVDAGYEWNGQMILVPCYTDGRGLPQYSPTSDPLLYAVLGPKTATVHLRLAGRDDPRAGVSFSSVAPGRIVVERSFPSPGSRPPC